MTPETRKLYEAYQVVFTSPAGKLVLADLKKISGVDNAFFPSVIPLGQTIDTNRLIFCEARRGLVLGIVDKIERVRDDPTIQITAKNDGE